MRVPRFAIACLASLVASTAQAQVWPVGNRLVEHESSQLDAYFGAALAAGDLDADGDDDLVVGAPAFDRTIVEALVDSGRVNIYFGEPSGDLAFETGLSPAVADVRAGSSLAVGDFDCSDYFLEVAVGLVELDLPGAVDAGGVWILHWTGSSFEVQATISQADILGSSPETNDHFGAVLAAGDFDADGCDDLAIGTPDEDHIGFVDKGLVQVVHGAEGGLDFARDLYFLGDAPGDGFGYALASGNFDGDGYDDLAVGSPWHIFDFAVAGAGQVSVFYGSLTGLGYPGSQTFDEGDLAGAAAYERFGSALAAADFDSPGALVCATLGGCADDLAIGVPGQDLGYEGVWEDAGAVRVLYGVEDDGLSTAGASSIDQNDFAADEHAETADSLGDTLAAGALDPPLEGARDLLIGVPWETRTALEEGVVHVVLGAPAGLDPATARQTLRQLDGVAAAPPEVDDRFGHALAIGDFDGDGWGDAAIGAPGNDGRGAVQILFGALFADGFDVGVTCLWDEPPCD